MLIVGLTLLLKRTVLGQQIRAVRGNVDMAPAVGVNVRLIFLIVFALGSFIAGVAAIFDGVRFAVTPAIGDDAIFYAFVVVFLAGSSRSPLIVGAVGLGIGVAQSISTIWVSENLSAITVFGLLFVFLAVRSVPDGLRRLSGALSRTVQASRGRAGRRGRVYWIDALNQVLIFAVMAMSLNLSSGTPGRSPWQLRLRRDRRLRGRLSSTESGMALGLAILIGLGGAFLIGVS